MSAPSELQPWVDCAEGCGSGLRVWWKHADNMAGSYRCSECSRTYEEREDDR